MTTTDTQTTPRLFLTDYASYNNGTEFEFGHWIDLTEFSDADELRDYITDHFAEADEQSPLDSPREETMFTDFEGFPRSLYSESGGNLDNLFEYLELLNSCSYDPEVVEAFAELGNYSLDNPEDFFGALEESYQGQYNSDEDFAQELAEQIGFENPTSWPYNCIDWERAAKEIMYDYYESNGHYFRAI